MGLCILWSKKNQTISAATEADTDYSLPYKDAGIIFGQSTMRSFWFTVIRTKSMKNRYLLIKQQCPFIITRSVQSLEDEGVMWWEFEYRKINVKNGTMRK